jgi:hypothetical protein
MAVDIDIELEKEVTGPISGQVQHYGHYTQDENLDKEIKGMCQTIGED